MSARATIRRRDEVFATAAGEMSEGSEYAFVAIATSSLGACYEADRERSEGGMREMFVGVVEREVADTSPWDGRQ